MFKLNVEKLTLIGQMMGEIPCNFGENFITVTFFPSFTAGCFNYQLNWKSNRGERSFNNLDDAIEILQELHKTIGA